jgi:probable addiction module antidote protein
MPKRTRDHQSWLIEKLTDPKRAASYLNAAREDSQEMFFEALRDVAQARQNMSHLAKDADVTRRSLYKVTSALGNPTYGTFDAVLRALGLDFAIKPRNSVPASTPTSSTSSSRRRATRLAAKLPVKLKRITFESRGVAASLGSAQHAGSSKGVDLIFRCTEKSEKRSSTFLRRYANPADNGGLPSPSPELVLEAHMSSALLERNYHGRQEDAGNSPKPN